MAPTCRAPPRRHSSWAPRSDWAPAGCASPVARAADWSRCLQARSLRMLSAARICPGMSSCLGAFGALPAYSYCRSARGPPGASADRRAKPCQPKLCRELAKRALARRGATHKKKGLILARPCRLRALPAVAAPARPSHLRRPRPLRRLPCLRRPRARACAPWAQVALPSAASLPAAPRAHGKRGPKLPLLDRLATAQHQACAICGSLLD